MFLFLNTKLLLTKSVTWLAYISHVPADNTSGGNCSATGTVNFHDINCNLTGILISYPRLQPAKVFMEELSILLTRHQLEKHMEYENSTQKGT